MDLSANRLDFLLPVTVKLASSFAMTDISENIQVELVKRTGSKANNLAIAVCNSAMMENSWEKLDCRSSSLVNN